MAEETQISILSGLTEEEFQERMERLDKLVESTEQLTLFEARRAEQAKKTLEYFIEQGPEVQKQIERFEELEAGDEAIKRKLRELRAIQKEVGDYNLKYRDLLKNANREMAKSFGEAGDRLNTSTSKLNKDLFKNAKKGSQSLHKLSGVTVDGISAMLQGSYKGIKHVFENITAETAVLGAFMSGITFKAFRVNLFRNVSLMDKALVKLAKQGFNTGAQIEESITAAVDPVGAFRAGLLDLDQGMDMLTNVGILGEDAANAFLALRQNAMSFRQSLDDISPGTTKFTINLIAGLNKLGVAQGESAEAIDIFDKVLGKTPKAAAKSITKIVKLASSLDLSTKQVFTDFTRNSKLIADYGDQAMPVFARLQAAARTTGIAFDQLAKIGDALDTQEAAAQAAQTLNFILGDSYVAMTDLLLADPAEKLDLAVDAFRRAGKDFMSLDRFRKRMAAAALKTDTPTLARLFAGDPGEMKQAKKELRVGEMSVDALTTKILDSMTAPERSQAAMSSFGAGMTKLVKRIRRSAAEMSDLIAGSFGKMSDDIGDSEEALITFMGTLAGLEMAAKFKSAKLGVAAATSFTTGLVGMGIDAVFGEGSAAKIEEFIGPGAPDLNQDGKIGTGAVREGAVNRDKARQGNPTQLASVTTVPLNVSMTLEDPDGVIVSKAAQLAVELVDGRIPRLLNMGMGA